MPERISPRRLNSIRAGASRGAERARARLKKENEALVVTLKELLDQFAETEPGRYAAVASAEDIERWRAALPDDTDPAEEQA